MMYWVMAAYQFFILVLDLLHLIVKCTILYILSIYRFFDPPKLKSVVGEVVLITGAGHGIGKELSLQFARLGAKVVCLDLNEEWNKQTVAQITKEGGSAWPFWCDVSNPREVKDVSDKIRQVVGDVTILVNNAGIMPCKPFLRHSKEDIEKLFAVNVFAHFWMLQEWLPNFLQNGRGHIVAMSSMCGLLGTSNVVPYCSSKFAVTGLMEALGEELRSGEQNQHIKLTRVHPFFIDTGLVWKPRIRFPSITRLQTPERCAYLIIQSVRQDEEVVIIPYEQYYLYKFMMILPRKIQKAFVDFMDTGADSHED